jgi:DNA-binding response OmpR family regulator
MYVKIIVDKTGREVETLMSNHNFIIIFIDSTIQNPTALDILCAIRKQATRRKTSVIMLAHKIDKASVVRYRNSGTDNIIVAPFSPNKIRQKVFESVTMDRKK